MQPVIAKSPEEIVKEFSELNPGFEIEIDVNKWLRESLASVVLWASEKVDDGTISGFVWSSKNPGDLERQLYIGYHDGVVAMNKQTKERMRELSKSIQQGKELSE